MWEILAGYQSKFINSTIALLMCLIAYILLKLFVDRHVKSRRRHDRVIVRLKFILTILIILFLFRIWVVGFFQILAIFSFVAASIILTQKSNLLNLISSFIVKWRELFVEGDIIEIGHIKGRVKQMGLLYLTLNEVKDELNQESTGRIIKIPNGLISKHSLINYSQVKRHRYLIKFIFPPSTSFLALENSLKGLHDEVKKQLAEDNFMMKEIDDLKIKLNYALSEKPLEGIVVQVICHSNVALKHRVTTLVNLYCIKMLEELRNVVN